ncbi:MAG TPA: hypothetical protein VK550_24560, partial [Polyangiaceae bacterium]|nr:hypothetical protein [Polyangiaceae bacterium]
MQRRAAIRKAAQLLAAVVFLAAPLRAAPATMRLDGDFVARLSHRGPRRHPLADGSGRLPLVIEVPPSADVRALDWLPLSGGLATVRVAPADLAGFVAAHADAHFSIWPGLHAVLDVSARLNRVDAYRAALAARGSPLAGTGQGVVVGIVDTSVDVTHPDL